MTRMLEPPEFTWTNEVILRCSLFMTLNWNFICDVLCIELGNGFAVR